MARFSPLNMLDFTHKIESHQVNWERGAAEPIQYRYRADGKDQTPTEARAFIDYGDIRKEDSDERKDKVYFYMVKLTKEPVFHDSIKYDGKIFLVEEWKKHNKYSDLYDLVTTSNRSLKHKRFR